MKILFVAEGDHELGKAGGLHPPHTARGVLFTLVRKIVPNITDGLALRWTEISLFPINRSKLDRDLKKKGLDIKVKRAVLLSALVFGCDGTICVVDGDTAANDCLATMAIGREEAFKILVRSVPVVFGVAMLSIEAWTLGARQAIADCLGVPLATIGAEYPKRKHIEELFATSGIESNRPKNVLRRIVALAHCNDSTELREAIAEATSIAEPKRECPKGFAPFVDELMRAFGAN